MTLIKPVGHIASEEDGWREGDKVRVTRDFFSLGYTAGQIFTLKKRVLIPSRFYISEKHNIGFDIEFELVSRKEDEEELWSEWEFVSHIDRHSKYYSDCDYEFRKDIKKEAGKQLPPVFTCRIKLKPPVKVSELSGTVQMVDGKPDWSTYKE